MLAFDPRAEGSRRLQALRALATARVPPADLAASLARVAAEPGVDPQLKHRGTFKRMPAAAPVTEEVAYVVAPFKLDREEGGAETFTSNGYSFRSLLTIRDFGIEPAT